jgi:O-antigen/teichoic acid export membrane protein
MVTFGGSAVNQLINSAINFCLQLFLVRELTPPEFGLYGISFILTFALSAVCTDLFIVPMTVSLANYEMRFRKHYMGRILRVAAGSVYLTAIVVTLCSALAYLLGWISAHTSLYVTATALSAAGMFAKEAVVQISYNEGKSWRSILINLVTASCLVFFLLLASRYSGIDYAWKAILAFAVAQCVGFSFGSLHLIPLVQEGDDGGEKSFEVRHLLKLGRWSSTATLLSLLRTQSHAAIAGILLGPGAVGAINASRIVFSPIQVLTPTIMRASLPRLVFARKDRPHRLFGLIVMVICALVGTTVLYCILAYSMRDQIFGMLAGHRYRRNEALLLVWALYTSIVSVRIGLEIIPTVFAKTKDLLPGNAIGSVVSVVCVLWLTTAFGAPESLVGISIAELIAALYVGSLVALRYVPAIRGHSAISSVGTHAAFVGSSEIKEPSK